MWLTARSLLALGILLLPLSRTSATSACGQPNPAAIAATFDFAANGSLALDSSQIPGATGPGLVPASLLMAIGWVESGWRQFTPRGDPLLSSDFGYGIMQITSGMDGAFGRVHGSLAPQVQSRIATDFRFNIAAGARILEQKWRAVPMVGSGDPSVLEDWYYAIWAYNGWGWVNNPNNPRFARHGNPASDPGSYPYQERVLYLVAHPPHDADGNPLWPPVPVALPSRGAIGDKPAAYKPAHRHRAPPASVGVVYQPSRLTPFAPGAAHVVSVRLVNTGTAPWTASNQSALALTYHLFTTAGDPWHPFSATSPGVLVFGADPVTLPRIVLPGQSITVNETVQAPSAPGQYRLVWDLEEGAGQYFSAAGILPHAQRLTVGSKALSPAPTPTTTPEPDEDAHFLADTSTTDGSVLKLGQLFAKGWLLFNPGKSGWADGVHLRRISGPSFGASTISVPLTASCRTVNVVATLRAPRQRGSYKAVWRMQDPSGHLFGDRLTVVVTVKGTPPRHPTPTPSAVVTPTPTPVG